MKFRAGVAMVVAGGILVSAVVGASTAGTSARHRAAVSSISGTLTYFDFGSAQNPPTQKLIQQYRKTHPHVRLRFISGPSSNEVAWLDTQLAGGTAPDVITLETNEQPWRDLNKGWWADLTKYANAPDPYVKGNKHWIDLLSPGAARLLKFANGRIYSMSTTGFDVGYIYNKDIWSKLQLTPPKTWAQMIADFEKIKSSGYIPLDWELGSHSYGGQTEQYLTILEGALMQHSIKRMDVNHDGVVDVKELIRGIRKHIYSAKNADYQEGWKLFKSLSPYFQTGASATTDPTKGFNLFKTGRVATWFEGSYNSSNLDQASLHWSAFVEPRITSATSKLAAKGPQPTGGFGACCGYAWGVPQSAVENGGIKVAMDFIYWMSTPKHTDQFAKGGGVLSTEKKAAPLRPQLKPFAVAATHISPLATGELSLPEQFIENRSRLLEEYVNGTIDLPTAMQRMQAEMNADAAQAARIYGVK
jgi:ABC-type glycerol-3-phosphate transport system substrate-binding protein